MQRSAAPPRRKRPGVDSDQGGRHRRLPTIPTMKGFLAIAALMPVSASAAETPPSLTAAGAADDVGCGIVWDDLRAAVHDSGAWDSGRDRSPHCAVDCRALAARAAR